MITKNKQELLIEFTDLDIMKVAKKKEPFNIMGEKDFIYKENAELLALFKNFSKIEKQLFENAIRKDLSKNEYKICNKKHPLPKTEKGYDRYLIANDIVYRNLDNNKEYIFHIVDLNEDEKRPLSYLWYKGKTLKNQDINKLKEIAQKINNIMRKDLASRIYDFSYTYDNYLDWEDSIYTDDYFFDTESHLNDVKNISETIDYILLYDYLEESEVKDDPNQMIFELQKLRNNLMPFEVEIDGKKYYLEVIVGNNAFYIDDFSEKVIEVDLLKFDSNREFTPESTIQSEKSKADLYKEWKENKNKFSYVSVSFTENYKYFQNKNKENDIDREK